MLAIFRVALLSALGIFVTVIGAASSFADTSARAPTFESDPLGYFVDPFRLAERPVLKQSIFVFGGMTSGRDIWSVAAFNLNRSSTQRHYDNYIVGAAYQHDLVRLNGGLVFGAEIGLAERFGHYKSCCDNIVYSDSLVTSPELWGGLTVRYDAVNVFNLMRVSPGIIFGLSGIGNPIGQELQNAIPGQSSARLLFYVGLEGAFALPSMPDTEFVVRLHHRSGGYGTLGGLKEGNNANTFGIRYRF